MGNVVIILFRSGVWCDVTGNIVPMSKGGKT